jgi:hypothetical protein
LRTASQRRHVGPWFAFAKQARAVVRVLRVLYGSEAEVAKKEATIPTKSQAEVEAGKS